MRKVSIIFIVTLFSIVLSPYSTAIELTRGIVYGEDNWEELTKTHRDAGFLYSKAAVETNVDGIVAVYDSGLSMANIVTNELLDAWPITPWPSLVVMEDENSSARNAKYLKYQVQPDDDQILKTSHTRIDTINQKGCLSQYPLRYGNFSDDGDIVVISNNVVSVSSTLKKKMVFAFNWVNKDEVNQRTMSDIKSTENEYVHGLHGQYLALGNSAPQYLAESSENILVQQVFPAWRSFAKVYVSDFTGNEKSDILMWRKLFKSRLVGDPVTGYKKAGDLLVHYALINGEYKLQETEQDQIKKWLTDNQLTWSKGFPSISECSGEEGQLIPEMHDILLNDPDVLEGTNQHHFEAEPILEEVAITQPVMTDPEPEPKPEEPITQESVESEQEDITVNSNEPPKISDSNQKLTSKLLVLFLRY